MLLFLLIFSVHNTKEVLKNFCVMEDSKTVNLTVSPKLTKAKPKVTTISLFSHDGGELTDLLKGVKPISGDRLQSGSQGVGNIY